MSKELARWTYRKYNGACGVGGIGHRLTQPPGHRLSFLGLTQLWGERISQWWWFAWWESVALGQKLLGKGRVYTLCPQKPKPLSKL